LRHFIADSDSVVKAARSISKSAKMSDGSLPDWITATSTGITAVATGAAAFVAWVALRREARASRPIIEPEFYWFEDYLALKLIIRNQLYETIILDSASVIRPRRSLISKDTKVGPDGGFGGVIKGNSSIIKICREISPVGTAREAYSGLMRRTDVSRVDLYLSPPGNWNGGVVKVDLRISSKSLTIRDMRVAINRSVSPKIIKQTDERANNVGWSNML
jgi:hypothetical protein